MDIRKLVFFLIGLLLPAIVAAAPSKKETKPAAEMSGKEIYEEIAKRHGRPTEFEIQKITLTDSKGAEEVRDVKRYSRTVGPGEHRYLMVFHSPPPIRGAATITWKRRFKKDGQWIYLPATGGKPIRLVGGGKKNYVMGTDFTAEDLASESSDKMTFERQENEILNGKAHFVIDISPKDAELKAETGYKRRRLWIDKENFVLMRTDYFDWRDTLIKRQTASGVKKIEDDMWRADTQTMENFKDGHKTRVEVIERKFDADSVPLDLFFERTLISGDHVR
ncbi:MAG: outer membrane lipoprotein-sorting protein [Hyphomicrobiaceae bacterium]|nr:outer membrane lipoprotein-sorting protein [Hyphomicrobiaceae bacterium]